MYQILQGLAFIHKHGKLCFSCKHFELEQDSVCVKFFYEYTNNYITSFSKGSDQKNGTIWEIQITENTHIL